MTWILIASHDIWNQVPEDRQVVDHTLISTFNEIPAVNWCNAETPRRSLLY
jgi:hypothetical protein